MKKQKLTGRAGYVKTTEGNFGKADIALRVKIAPYSTAFFRITAQSTVDNNPDCFYAVRVENMPMPFDSEFDDGLKFLGMISKAIRKQKAPRAKVGTDGKAYMTNCDLACLLLGLESLGINVTIFQTWNEAFEFSYKVEGEDKNG